MYKLRTVDVWDTLLRRDCHPECIKLATAMYLFLGWFNFIKPDFQDYWSLYHARVDSERHLAKVARAEGGDDEYEITHVLKYWVGKVFSSLADASLPSKLAAFELQTEMERSFVDPTIIEFLRPYRAEKTLFLSDFYMGTEMLRRLLTTKGLNSLIKDGISSCDVGVNKRSGRLFQHLYNLNRILPTEHIHIGDNPWSDVESPKKLGATGLHFFPEMAHAERLKWEKLFSTRGTLFEHVRRECSNLAERAMNGMADRTGSAFRLGIEIAPLFIGFALWIAERAVLEKLERVYFFTREGEFFHQVYSVLFPTGKLFGHDLPISNILEVSRLATFTASMQDASIEEMSRIWTLFKSQSISGLFITLGLNIDDFSIVLEMMGLKATDFVDDPLNHPAIHQLFRTNTFINALKQAIRNQRGEVYGYLEQSGLLLSQRVGIVDIGWRGTIQDNLAILAPHTYFYGMYLGLRRFINAQPGNIFKSAYGPDENRSLEFCNLFENFSALELLCSSPSGSVVGFKRIGGTVIPQRQIVESENVAFESFTRHFQSGVLLAAQHWQSYIERYVLTGAEFRGMALHIWDILRRTPCKDLAEIFMQVPQHDFFGFGDILQRNRLPSLKTILLAPIFRSKRRQLIEFIRRVQWPEAISHTQGIGHFHRGMLILIFRLANWVKYIRMKAY